MRQKSRTSLHRGRRRDLRLGRRHAPASLRHDHAVPSDPGAYAATRYTAAGPDRAQRRRHAILAALSRPFPRTPSPRTHRHAPHLARLDGRRGQQPDLRAPPPPVAVAFGLVRDQPRKLQVI